MQNEHAAETTQINTQTMQQNVQQNATRDQEFAQVINYQYLVVQDYKDDRKGDKSRRRTTANTNAYDWTNINGPPVAVPDDIADKEKLIDGEDTYYSKLHNETLNSLD